MIIRALMSHFAACAGGGFLGFPTWYKYLPSTTPAGGLCSPQITKLDDVWLILAAVIEIMLRIAALVQVIFTMYGGFRYGHQPGDPSKIAGQGQG